MAGTNITFASNSLQTASIITENIDHSSPTKLSTVLALAHANASAVPFQNYPTRTIKIGGTLVGSSIANCDLLVDTFKSYLLGIDKNLDIDYGGGTRRYIATPNAPSISRPGNLAYAKFDVEFICTDPFGRDISTTTALSATGRTLSTYNDNYTFIGTAPYQLPVVTITVTAVTGATAQSIQWGNGATGQAIFVQRTWVAGDVLVIDSVLKTVTVNGSPAAFSGAFAEFAPGAQTLQYSDTFTTRTFTVLAQYIAGYL